MVYMEDMLPYLYTPTVGEACQRYHQLPIATYGLYLSAEERDSFLDKFQKLENQDSIAIIVVTDGERILGLGDLGTGGMGISEGKSLLYIAAGGVSPSAVLPVCLDVGTNNSSLLNDPKYPGLRRERLTEPDYDDVLNRFISALLSWKRHVCLQVKFLQIFLHF